jgi:hypothetical protein
MRRHPMKNRPAKKILLDLIDIIPPYPCEIYLRIKDCPGIPGCRLEPECPLMDELRRLVRERKI